MSGTSGVKRNPRFGLAMPFAILMLASGCRSAAQAAEPEQTALEAASPAATQSPAIQPVPPVVYRDGTIPATLIDAGYDVADGNYHAIAQASDGNVYYVLNSHNVHFGARMFRYTPKTGEVATLADFTDLLGYDRTQVVCQGKVHCDLYEHEGKLWFGTHAGTYESEGLKRYPGGHFMTYDLATGKFTDLGMGVPENGIISMTPDWTRGRLYMMGWPNAEFAYYDLAAKQVTKLGRSVIFTPEEYVARGQIVHPNNPPGPLPPRSLDDSYEKRILLIHVPRSLGLDPNTGDVYFHNANGSVVKFAYASGAVEQVPGLTFDRPIFHIPLPVDVGTHWRSLRWNGAMQRFYGVMYYSDYLFSFDPKTQEIEVIDRIAAGPNRRSGQIAYSSLGFELSPDGRTVYYVAQQDVKGSGQPDRVEMHLVTYDIPQRQYIDHGIIELADGRRPRYCQGLEIGTDGNLYLVCWIDVADTQSERGQRIVKAQSPYRSAADKDKPFTEVNLIVVRDPLNAD